MTDLELTRAIAQKGEQAYSAMSLLFERHFRILCRRYRYQFPALSEDEVVDIVSNSMLVAFEKAHTFKGNSSFQTWLGSIVRNAILNHLDATKRQNHVSIDSSETEEQAFENTYLIDEKTPLTDYQLNIMRECVRVHFAQFRDLYPEASLAIFEHFIEKTDLKELSILLNRSYGATRQFVSKEAAKLRSFLEPCLAHLQQ